MLTAIEAASAVVAPVVPVLGEVATIVSAASLIIQLTIKLLPYAEKGAVVVKNGIVVVTTDLDTEAQKLIRYLHTL